MDVLLGVYDRLDLFDKTIGMPLLDKGLSEAFSIQKPASLLSVIFGELLIGYTKNIFGLLTVIACVRPSILFLIF
jgi:hypothetical protein